MLKYNLKLKQNSSEFVEVKCENLFFADDLTYISGITDSVYGLVNGQPIYVCVNDSSEMQEYKVEAQNVEYQGYVIFKEQEYKVEKFVYEGNNYFGIIYADGKKYIDKTGDGIHINSYMNPHLERLFVFNKIETVKLATKYYIVNNFVSIGGISYYIDSETLENVPQLTLKNGTRLRIYYENRQEKTHFIIRKNFDYGLSVEHASCTKEYKYIYSGVSSTSLLDENITQVSNQKLYLCEKYDNGIAYYLSAITSSHNGDTTVINVDCEYNPSLSIDKVTVTKQANDNEEEQKIDYILHSEWRNVTYGNFIHLYLENNRSIHEGDIIKITPKYSYNQWVGLDENNNISYNGKLYPVTSKKDFLVYKTNDNNSPKELLINYTTDNWKGKFISKNKVENPTYGFVQLDNSPFLLYDIKNGKAKRKIEYEFNSKKASKEEFDVKTYSFVEIDGIEYKVIEQTKVIYTEQGEKDEIVESGITISTNNPFRLSVIDVVSESQLRCEIIDNLDDNSGFLYLLSLNTQDFLFELENQLFSNQMIDNLPTIDKDYIYDNYSIYIPTDYIVLPIQFSSSIANNLHQEYIYENVFFDVESDKAINRIIDMEKNIYLPAKDMGDYFTLVDELVFDLHFRSRDLTTWTINEDYIGQDTNIKCNWNIFDYYNNDFGKVDDKLKPLLDDSELKYYQPADLLFFLGFTDDDVFYQKQKVGKSFLRLSFYDSNNPLKQSLLHTATVFVDEGKLYKTYIDNMQSKSHYIGVNEITKQVERIYSDTISVRYDTYDEDTQMVIPNEEKRLAAHFSIKNMYESSESSEGFYLYLFKEFNNGLHERTIYMTVEFNHAGYGKTVKFTQPHDGNYNLLTYSDMKKDDFLRGYPLNTIYDYLYIPIKVKYDFNLKKYFYYLPKGLVKNDDNNVMRFNLYELKIADDSIKK